MNPTTRHATTGATIYLQVILTALLLIFSRPGNAETLEKPALKQGYYFALVPTFDMVFVDSKVNMGPWPSAGGQFRMGEELNRWFDLGISGGASVAMGDNYRLIHGNFGVDATFKPTRFLALGIQAGIGFADFSRMKSPMPEVIGRFGATYGVTVAYDFFPGRRSNPHKSGGLAITPVIGAHMGPADVTSVYTIFAGVSFSWWTGLPKNKLDLPIDDAF